MISSAWLGAATIAAMAAVSSAADHAHIHSMPGLTQGQMNSEMALAISAPSAGTPQMSYTIVPMTPAVGLGQDGLTRNSISIVGNLVLATHLNYNNITGSKIAYLCCDNQDNSFTDPDDMLYTLMANAPRAILLYSQEGTCCGLNASSGLTYQSIFTMASISDAAVALNFTNSDDGVIRAAISGNVTTADQSQTTSSGTSTSSIAMSILYSITGLITALFLIIIATGAIRAHRYPDRYGPRSGREGLSRQSRARGLARAVLETLPIVKFGDPTPTKPDLGTELESQLSSEPSLATTDVQVHHLSAIPEDSVSQPKSVAHTTATTNAVPEPPNTTNIGPADTAIGPSSDGLSQSDDHLGCSICTEDFTVGEDVRVLPCNHKFHPTCVDPWLVNVSGTCPLCRLDLRPKDGEEDDTSSTGEMHLPPPLGDDEAAAAVAGTSTSGQHRHRASRLFDLNRLRHASAEERIEALRRYRSETQTDGDDEHGRSVRLTRRLRDKFHIRTHAQSSG
ncbi:ring finger domain protein [Grosmannia clavigera kw1407]|uniref:Ring finger domain protein n=1 Tax=Grosmannia clavigera (strain kw1407 / UAMH 11150) TaxID=655863 RepID=F0XTQ2_GROCL|nr:ring finger domain protein [Grosmannia clavigera kw1407]EFW98674.1 ring finger domain protein [Grosmannia clavigera kw1407]